MGNTPNNNFPYPESTDLVKDGAQNIEDLAAAIDTTLGVYAPSSSGLELINTTSFSGFSSQSFNNVFTSTYRNYRINFSGSKATVGDINLRLRASGTDNTASNYQRGRLFVGGQVSQVFGSENNTTSTSHPFQANDSKITGAFIDVFHPQITGNTSILSFSAGRLLDVITTNLTVTTAFDGFTIFAADNIAGEINVYGYNV